MTEIEFLVTLLLDSSVSESTKTKIAERIGEVERTRSIPSTGIIYYYPYQPYIGGAGGASISYSCQHEYPSSWGSTSPPSCTKCGRQMGSSNTLTIYGSPSGQGSGISGNGTFGGYQV